MVLAGPGSGKTMVITNRIKALIDSGVRPESILVITFTRAAAAQMRTRFLSLVSPKTYHVTFGTFHAIFFQILKHAYNYGADSILRPEENFSILVSIAEQLHITPDDMREWAAAVTAEISRVKSEQIPLEYYYSTSSPEEEFRKVYRLYDERLRRAGKIDFDDMCVFTHDLFRARPDILASWQQRFPYILIDEFQDINAMQYRIIRMLAAPKNNLFIVGDDDQSIYRFRGSKPELMLGFPKDYPDAEVIELQENYRSTPQIVAASLRVIGANKSRFQKELRSAGGRKGESVEVMECRDLDTELLYVTKCIKQSLAQGRDASEIAILTRTNLEARSPAEKLSEFAVPYTMKDAVPILYDHWIAQDILAYLRLSRGIMQRSDFLRVCNRPNRYISRQSIEAAKVMVPVKDANGPAGISDGTHAPYTGAPGREAASRNEIPDNRAASSVGFPGGRAAVPGGFTDDTQTITAVSWTGLKAYYHDKEWIHGRLYRFEDGLKKMGTMRPYAAINYLRQGMDYDKFIHEYARQRRLDEDELTGIADEVQDHAKRFETLKEWEEFIENYRYEMEEARQNARSVNRSGAADEKGRVTLATLHSSKGLEFEEVFLLNVNESVIPYRKATLEAEIEEERRLFYVGMTRAKQKLHILFVKERYNKKLEPSRFLDQLRD